jgi:hypothetical protein
MIKSLVIGYVKVNSQQEKKQVLRLIATMLSFSPSEIETCEHAGESKWFGLLKPSGSSNVPQKSPQNKNLLGVADQESNSLNKSFTELLIQYVDKESKPKPAITFNINDSETSPSKNAQSKKLHDSAAHPLTIDESSLANSASAVKFFNNSLGGASGGSNDLNLVNRTSSQPAPQIVQNYSNSNQPQISNPALANSFLEQILKQK